MVQHQLDMTLDELILQVFEEQEDQFHFPVCTQNAARAFVKALHASKGMPFLTICQEIGEFEHNFSAWRKGLGRPGIGNRMIERINRPLQELLMSDEEDEVDAILQRKKNKGKSSPVPDLQDVLRERNGDSRKESDEKVALSREAVNVNKQSTKHKTGKDQGITESWLNQVEKKTDKTDAVMDKESVASDSPVESDRWESEPLNANEKHVVEKGELPETITKNDTSNGLTELDTKHKSSESSGDNEDDNSSIPPTTIPDETGALDSMGPVSIESGLPSLDEPPLKVVEGDKRISCMDAEKAFDDLVDEVDEGKKSLPSVARSRSIPAPLVVEEEDLDDDESSVSGNGKCDADSATESSEVEDEESSDDVDENYDSDLDPEVKDKVPELMTVSKQLQAIKSQSHDDCSGYIYVFTDSGVKDEVHRVKIGASRCPQKRLQQARAFNIDMRLVTAVPVNGQQTAAGDMARTLEAYAVEGHDTWFEAPLNHIINTVSKVADKHPATSSDC